MNWGCRGQSPGLRAVVSRSQGRMIGCGAKGRPGLDLAQEGGGAESRGWCHPGDTGELGRKVVSAVQTALARRRCACSHPGRKLSLAFGSTRSLGWTPASSAELIRQ